MFIIALARRTAKRWTTFGGFLGFLSFDERCQLPVADIHD
jgi:hypothetical protein